MDIRFCDHCSESIPDADFDAGKAVSVGGRHFHGACALARGLSLGGPRTWLTFLLALYAAGVATWLLVAALGREEKPAVTAEVRSAIQEAVQVSERKEARNLEQLGAALRAESSQGAEKAAATLRGELSSALEVFQGRLDERDRLAADHLEAHRGRLEDLDKEVAALNRLLQEIKQQADRLEAQRSAPAPTPVVAPPPPEPAPPTPEATPTPPAPEPAPGHSQEVERWIRRLSDPNENIRFSATLELGRLKDLAAAAPLIAVLKDDRDYYVRLGAATALGDIKSVDAVEPLIDALDADDDALVRTAANDALQAITEQPFEFVPGMTRTERRKLQSRWRAWFKENEAALRDRLGQPKTS